MTPLNYEAWKADEQARSLLEHHYGWREPTWEDLEAERWAREDRLQDFTPVVVGLTNPAPRTGAQMTAPCKGRTPVHHSSAGSPAPSPPVRAPAEQTFTQRD